MKQTINKLVVAGKYAAEVPVTRIPDDDAWGPYLTIDDALKLEAVEQALKTGDIAAATKLARVYELKPVAAE